MGIVVGVLEIYVGVDTSVREGVGVSVGYGVKVGGINVGEGISFVGVGFGVRTSGSLTVSISFTLTISVGDAVGNIDGMNRDAPNPAITIMTPSIPNANDLLCRSTHATIACSRASRSRCAFARAKRLFSDFSRAI